LIVLAFLTLYLHPNIRQRKRLVLAGSVVTTALWIGATMLFRIYVVNFGNYNQTYGTIGAVIVLLTWMYLSMLVVLIGGELTSELHKGTGSLWPRRGAVINERIATHFTRGRKPRQSRDTQPTCADPPPTDRRATVLRLPANHRHARYRPSAPHRQPVLS